MSNTSPEQIAAIVKCHLCGGSCLFDTVLPSVVWNEQVRAAGGPEYLCAACIMRHFAVRGESFTCELWGDGLSGIPVSVHVNNKRARAAQMISAENTDLRVRLQEAERACQQLREKIAVLLQQQGPDPAGSLGEAGARLRALVAAWRGPAAQDATLRGYLESANTLQCCANELEATLDALLSAPVVPSCVCQVEDGLVQEWVSKAREVAKGKGFDVARLSAPVVSGWQPIATAPKDRSTVLGYTPYASVVVGDIYYNCEQEQWWRLPDEHVVPTHWMPLPAAPVVTQEGE